MTMKYFGKPHQFIVDYGRMRNVFQFNEKGEFVTEDEKLIAFMKKEKWFIPREECGATKPPQAAGAASSPKVEPGEKPTCPMCGKTYATPSSLNRHIREKHPQEG